MNKDLKIGLVLLIAASVLFLCSTVAFYILREAEKEKVNYLKKELDTVNEAKAALTKNLEELKVAKQELEIKLSSLQEEKKKIYEELLREKEAKKLMSAQLEQERKKSDSLMTDIMSEKEKYLKLLQQLSEAQEDYQRLKDQYELVLEAKETLEEKYKAMMARKGIELERIEVRKGYQKEENKVSRVSEKHLSLPAHTKSGDVLVVNRRFNFIVANLGKLDGVDVGAELDVYRDSEFIAKTKVEKLYDRMSAATLLPGWEDAVIKEGDQVYISY